MSDTKKNRYLTKSRYKLALSCPTKLYYTGKQEKYADSTIEDPFLKALARGGFQIGALAQGYFPDGIEVREKDHDEAIEKTASLLRENENITIFEAAIGYETLFVRVDILKKTGNVLQLIEVKSKSVDSKEAKPFFDKTAFKRGIHKLKSDFASYLYDVAYQAYVCRKALPEFSLTSFLMLPNKRSTTTVDGLNQIFLLKDVAGQSSVSTKAGLTKGQLGAEILIKINVDEAVNLIHSGQNAERPTEKRCQSLSYHEEISYFAEMYAADKKISTVPGAQCKQCEFRVNPRAGLASGFNECWQSEMKVKSENIHGPFVFDIWNFRQAQKLINDGKLFIKEIVRDDIEIIETVDEDTGLSMSERQWLQIERIQSGNREPFIDIDGLKKLASSWHFPLHFIDFETTTVAIPFTNGRRPYEQIAFQFSHHIFHDNGRIEHANQYLNCKRGTFPNFDFVRMLRRCLGHEGTIFRYAAHENTVLCQIYEQLKCSAEPDAKELMAWIQTITTSSSKIADPWDGPRSMVDLCEMVKRYYYHPLTDGSNSIKRVLPAILNASTALQQRYSKPIYGSNDITSLNYSSWSWIEFETDGSVKDPYKRLPSIYHGLSRDDLDLLMAEDELADGGAAMMAYAMMQFTEMAAEEHKALYQALLRYCELDTFAMVLIYEYWADLIGITYKSKAA